MKRSLFPAFLVLMTAAQGSAQIVGQQLKIKSFGVEGPSVGAKTTAGRIELEGFGITPTMVQVTLSSANPNIAFVPATVSVTAGVTCRVKLNGPSPGLIKLPINNSNPAVATVDPPYALFQAGDLERTFTVTAVPIAQSASTRVGVTYGDATGQRW